MKSVNTFVDTHTVKLTLQWIPGHVNIPGNEQADKLAKQGTTCPQPNLPTSYSTAKQIIKTNKKEEWMNKWALGKTGRSMFAHMTTPNPKDNINYLQRREQVVIFRLRSHHIPLNAHLNKIQPQHVPTCPLCPYPYETVTHHLFECPSLKDLRARHLPPDPNLHNTLYTDTEQLRRTYTYHVMAMCQRAKAQETTGSEK